MKEELVRLKSKGKASKADLETLSLSLMNATNDNTSLVDYSRAD